jgi:hypothetical protein
MSATPMPDPSQQPITADDPRVAQILALIRAKTGTAGSIPTTDAPAPTQIAPIAPPPVPTQLGGPTLQHQATPQDPGPAPNIVAQPPMVPQQNPQLPQPAPPNVVPPSQPGPIKSFLQHLVSGLGNAAYSGQQALLQHAGLPTDYEKQQNAAHLAIAQQAANDTSQYRQSLTDLTTGKSAQLAASQVPVTIPTDPKYGAFSGMTLPTAAATPIMQRMEALQNAKDIAAGKNTTTIQGKQIQYGPGSYLRRGVRSIGGQIISYDKGDPTNPDLTKVLGPDTSMITGPRNAQARAQANAMYRTFETTDANGAPVTISGLDALPGGSSAGAAQVPYAQAKGILSDKVGVQQYQDILDNKIAPNLAVLNDNAQRIAIAHTLSEVDKNPGAMQALLTSALQEGALSPQGAQLTAGIMQAREFGGVARKYGGNMNGTEGLMNRIMSNQAAPLNSLQLNQDLVANDRAFTQKALTNIGILQGHVAQGKTGPPNVAPTAAPAANGASFFTQFGGAAKQ